MITKSANFSDCRKYRYLLTRTWNEKKGSVFFVMLNPSTADENYNDPTISRCMKFAESWGYGGILIGNLFAYRATKPKEMMAAKDPIGDMNDFFLKQYSKFHTSLTVAAWGNYGSFMDRDKDILKILKNPHCLIMTKSGQPGHPLYLKGDLKPRKFPNEQGSKPI